MHFQLWLIIKQINHIIHLLNAHSALLSCPKTTFIQQCSAVAAGQCLGVSWGERSEVRGTGRGGRARAAASHTGPSLHLCSSCDSTQCEEKAPTLANPCYKLTTSNLVCLSNENTF